MSKPIEKKTFPLRFSYNATQDLLIIEGVKYSGGIFRKLGFGPIGSTVKLVSSDNGVITLQKVVPNEN